MAEAKLDGPPFDKFTVFMAVLFMLVVAWGGQSWWFRQPQIIQFLLAPAVGIAIAVTGRQIVYWLVDRPTILRQNLLYKVLHPRNLDGGREGRLRREWARFREGKSVYTTYIADLFKQYQYRIPEGATADEIESFKAKLVEPVDEITEKMLFLNEKVFVYFLNYYLDDFDQKLIYAGTTARPEGEEIDPLAEIVKELRELGARGPADEIEKEVFIQRMKRKYGDEFLDNPRVRDAFKRYGWRI